MSKTEWIETKKEGEIDENGKLIIKKVTLERTRKKYMGLERKDIIDISIRLISLGAIFIPLLLFYKQQKAERDKQKSFFQLELYSGTTTELHSILNKPLGSSGFDQTKNKLLYEIYPKLRLLSENVVTDTFLVLKDVIDYASVMSTAFNNCDSLRKQLGNFAETGGAGLELKTGDQIGEVLSPYIQNVVNSERELLRWKPVTQKGQAFTTDHQRKAQEVFLSLSKDAHTLRESLRVKSYNSGDGLNELAGYPDSTNARLPDLALLDRLSNSFDRVRSLRSGYVNIFNSQMQYYTTKLDSIMVESTKLLYSK
ncbi:MAG TPA: hypothetical protein VEZ17_10770 [Chitinophagaceae bacterium]|jgi:hypothetical protein|nr:hypothetical protein [Chitinophagaceae bacterium]